MIFKNTQHKYTLKKILLENVTVSWSDKYGVYLCVTSVKSFLSDSSQPLLRIVYLFLSSPKLMLLVYQVHWKEAKDKDVSHISPVDEAWIIVIISSSYPDIYIYIKSLACEILWD